MKAVTPATATPVTKDVIILIADDDAGHARLIEKNLGRAGVLNKILRFEDGQQILDFLFRRGNGPKRSSDTAYLLLLDIRMPKVDGIEVLRQLKANPELHNIPVTMLTTTDDPREVERCHGLGCNNYLVKPVDYDKFSDAIRQLGLFVLLVQVPETHSQA
jgi:CheY-like chemotaxis protein